MRTLLAALLAATAATTTLALASGGAPPPDPTAAPPNTVVAQGAGSAVVEAPQRRTNARIARAVRTARAAAIPAAVQAARSEAALLADAAGLTLGRVTGIARHDPPYFGQDTGRFGVGRWCGRATVGRRGERRRVWQCYLPREQTVNVRLTVEASPRR